ncbi:cation diffusion facilitator family transporter [Mesobacillus maritimus]|uniref:cation diffusion facilitator family transporter n=1 Tax=Mesobacillus maritimus TaxID=1643336 RepID=UPI00203E7EBD|nr:cation diffusion facilitator family transporter [Mesobacillus maritimus]MCM3586032.1 cation diffusion facilitator family transporter [Mesobacillus maritimus]MCM3671736.1 cation diffusion facilitator family transporter [Mesobacillus maritimus]
MERDEQIKSGEKGAWISIIAYLVLAAVKLTAGAIWQSDALWADGLNNSTDIIASVAVLIGLRISRKPADQNHLYGHYRAESIASLIASFIMVTVGLQVILDGIQSIFRQQTATPDMVAAWVALICAAAMYGISRYNLSLSQKINSSSIRAIAYDNRSDALVSVGAFIGIMGAQLGVPSIDTIAGIIVGVIICKTAWSIFYEATHTLTDGFDVHSLEHIKHTVQNINGVKEVTDIKARMHGNQVLVEATIRVNPNLNVIEGHEISEKVEYRLEKECNVQSATIHIEPVTID